MREATKNERRLAASERSDRGDPAAAELIEIFSAIQGEGLFVGRRQIFVRYGQCDVACSYCDTPLCHVTVESCRIETAPGARSYERLPNPLEPAPVAAAVRRLAKALPHHSISLTGGEPLLHPTAIAALVTAVRDLGLPVHLETNGHLPEPMRQVAACVDVVAMDVKLPSTAGFSARFDDNRRLLRIALDAGCRVFAKFVVGTATTDSELTEAVRVVTEVDPSVPLILQPVTPFRGCGSPPSPRRLLAMNDLALRYARDVAVIPQTHKMLGQA